MTGRSEIDPATGRRLVCGLPTIRPETALYGTSDQQICVATKIGFWLV